MIAVDTNVLVRYATQDDVRQSTLAARFLEETLTLEEPGFVSTVVVAELFWVLTRAYGIAPAGAHQAIRSLLEARQIAVENADAVARAIESDLADFPDALVHEVGRLAGCSRTVTLDRRFARMAGVDALG